MCEPIQHQCVINVYLLASFRLVLSQQSVKIIACHTVSDEHNNVLDQLEETGILRGNTGTGRTFTKAVLPWVYHAAQEKKTCLWH